MVISDKMIEYLPQFPFEKRLFVTKQCPAWLSQRRLTVNSKNCENHGNNNLARTCCNFNIVSILISPFIHSASNVTHFLM